jgi:hypothetical protein
MTAIHDALRELLHVAAGHNNLTPDEATALLAAVDADENPEPEPAPEPAPAGGSEAAGFASAED